jgi:hypothetical protein
MGGNLAEMNISTLHNRLDMQKTDIERTIRLSIDKKGRDGLDHRNVRKCTSDFIILYMEGGARKG